MLSRKYNKLVSLCYAKFANGPTEKEMTANMCITKNNSENHKMQT